ncbi:MAG: imidazolonepropionase [Planctomycetota bacterium]|nr:imidazolonepropionase [Planctomycetota bacterium]
MRSADLLILGATQVVTVDGGRATTKRGAREMNDLRVIEDGAIAVKRGRVAAVGTTNEILQGWHGMQRLHCRGRAVLPGFVDAHTHPVFAKPRDDEFAMRCRGEDYEAILAAGGGIHASARALRTRRVSELARDVAERLDSMLRHGTVAVEAKSGYGLTLASEMASLRAIRRAAARHPITAVRTFLGAHVVPQEYAGRRKAYIDLVIHEMLPRVAKQKLATFCDVFVEKGAFSVAEARKILRAGKRLGLRPKVHADQFRDSGGARLAAELKAISVEHVDATGPAGMRALAKARVVPVLLPSASLFTHLKHVPNARALIEAGCAVALATDFNPGTSPTENLQLVASLGCTLLGMTPEEVITAITRNAAAACGLGDTHGRIAVGRPAHLVIIDAPSYVHIPYRMGTNLVHQVLVNGRVVVDGGRLAEV